MLLSWEFRAQILEQNPLARKPELKDDCPYQAPYISRTAQFLVLPHAPIPEPASRYEDHKNRCSQRSAHTSGLLLREYTDDVSTN